MLLYLRKQIQVVVFFSALKSPYQQAWNPRRPLVYFREPGTVHDSVFKEPSNGMKALLQFCTERFLRPKEEPLLRSSSQVSMTLKSHRSTPWSWSHQVQATIERLKCQIHLVWSASLCHTRRVPCFETGALEQRATSYGFPYADDGRQLALLERRLRIRSWVGIPKVRNSCAIPIKIAKELGSLQEISYVVHTPRKFAIATPHRRARSPRRASLADALLPVAPHRLCPLPVFMQKPSDRWKIACDRISFSKGKQCHI